MSEQGTTEQNAPVRPLEALNLDDFRLGEDFVQIQLDSRMDNRLVAVALARQARRTIDLFSRDLEAELYDQEPFLQAVKDLTLGSPQAHLRVLLQDASRVVRDGHRLVELMRRLTSSIEIRQPHSDYRSYNEAFLVVDGYGVIHRRLADRPQGIASFKAPLRALELTKFFDDVWERSSPHPDLRRLYI
jgi:hypothetical protein